MGQGDPQNDIKTQEESGYRMKRWFKENMNVEIELQRFMDTQEQRISLMMLDSSYPELLAFTNEAASAMFIDSGHALDLAPLLEEYGQNILAEIGDYIELFKDEDGHIYRLPSHWGYKVDAAIAESFSIRYDWWLELGTELYTTPEEFYQQVKAIMANHPVNENGKTVYAFSDYDGGSQILRTAQEAWGLIEGTKLDENGNLVHWLFTDEGVERNTLANKNLLCTDVTNGAYWILTDACEDHAAVMKYLNWEWSPYGTLVIQYCSPAEDNVYDGRLCGHHEADAGFTHPDFLRYDFEVPYFSNSTEAWRGLRDIGRTGQSLGEKNGNAEWIEHGAALEKEAAELHEDILHALAESVLRDRGADFLPAIAGSKEYYYDYPYRSCPEAFDDNRVWCEMMHSGMVPKKYVDMILRDARIHNGMKLGIFGNRDLVVAFICYSEAYGLIQHDMIRKMQLFFYAHALHLHTRGTWSAFECVTVDRDSGRSTGYCPPAQMTMPAITKWMLVFEDPLSDAVHLCRATPKAWLANGESISVKDAPTKYGLVSFEIKSLIQDHKVEATLDIPEHCEETYLRLRLPEKKHIAAVCIDGKPVTVDMPDEETIRVPGTGRMQMTVTFD